MLLTPIPHQISKNNPQVNRLTQADTGRSLDMGGQILANDGSYSRDGGFKYLCLQWHWCLIAMLLLANIIAARYSLRAPNMHALCEAYSVSSPKQSLYSDWWDTSSLRYA